MDELMLHNRIEELLEVNGRFSELMEETQEHILDLEMWKEEAEWCLAALYDLAERAGVNLLELENAGVWESLLKLGIVREER